MKIVAFLLTAFLFVGCSGVNKVAHIDEFNMEVLATPEVRGVGKSLSSDTSVVRMALNVHVGAQEKEELSGIVNKRSSCKFRCDDAEDFELKEDVDAEYSLGYPIVSGSLDYFVKTGLAIIGFGFGIDHGGYIDGLLGVNAKYFEIGITGGFWVYPRYFAYHGQELYCEYDWPGHDTFSANAFHASSDMGYSWFFGGFASVFIGPITLYFSTSVYTPDPNYEDVDDEGTDNLHADFEFPMVITEYISVGYRFLENWEIRLGTANLFGEFPGWHWSFNGGVSYYL